MDLNQLRYFHEVVRSGGFTQASRRLRISQPAVSRMVQKLEASQGRRLLQRSRRGELSLTEAGKLVFASCERIFGELRELEDRLQGEAGELRGEVAVGASDNLCNYFFPSLLREFSRKHPRVLIQLFNGTSQSIQDELRKRSLEFGVFFTPVEGPGWKAERAGFVEFCLLSARPARLRDLAGLPYVGSRRGDYASSFPAMQMLEGLGLGAELRIQTNSQETQKRLVAEGIGFTVLPRFMARAELQAGTLHEVRAERSIGSPLYVVARANAVLTRAAEALRKEILAKVAALRWKKG